jgi:dynein heavy chain 1
MSSKEGERVPFTEVVDVKKHPSIHEWLGQVEYQMRNTLATLLEEAVEAQQSWEETDRTALVAAGSNATALATLKSNKEQRYFGWVDKYPAQIAVLATQVFWSEQVEAILAKCPKDVTASNHPLEALLKSTIETLTVRWAPAHARFML